MMRDAAGLVAWHETEPGRELEGANNPERDCLAVQQLVGKAGRGLEGVSKCVTRVEQRALAGLALVARDDPRLAAARDGDRVLARGGAPEHVLPICFQPSEESRITEQAELREFRIAGAK